MVLSMAIRKLFPSSSANQTFDGCPDICDPSYAYPDIDVLPPPLSPPLPPELYFTGHKSDQHVSPYVIIIIILLASLFLVVGCYVVIVKCCHGCSRLVRRTRSTDGEEVEFLDENHGPAVDHPIWYITTIGLQSSVINSITIVKYNKWDNLIEGTDCSVCLTEFQNEDRLRLLPKCNHAFHISCIDTWLRSHTNCPLCRAGIVYDNANSTTLAGNDQSSSAVGRNGEYHSGNVANGGEIMDFNQLRNEVIGGEEVADDDGMENCETDDQRKENKSIKTEVVLNGNGLFSLLGNSATKVKTMKRSLSVNLDSIGDTSLINFDERSSCIAETIPMRMKRSFSCTGRSFLSRHFRSKSAILPF